MIKNLNKKWLCKYLLFFIGYTTFIFYLHKQQDVWILWFGIGYLFFFILPILDKINSWLDKKFTPKNPYPVDEKFLKKLYPHGKTKNMEEAIEERQEIIEERQETDGEREEREYWEREEEYIRYEASKKAWDNMTK